MDNFDDDVENSLDGNEYDEDDAVMDELYPVQVEIDEMQMVINLPHVYRHKPTVNATESLNFIRQTTPLHKPNLQTCVNIMESDELLHAFLDEAMSGAQRVPFSEIQDWIMFLICAKSSMGEIRAQTFQKQKLWCENLIAQIVATVPQRVCPNSFAPGDIVWNCDQCQRDSTCVLCQSCYQNSNHQGHDVYFYQVASNRGGCCDCGDVEAWKPSGFCPNHGSSSALLKDSLPESIRTSSAKVFDQTTRWMADVSIWQETKKKNCTYALCVRPGFEPLCEGQFSWCRAPSAAIHVDRERAPMSYQLFAQKFRIQPPGGQSSPTTLNRFTYYEFDVTRLEQVETFLKEEIDDEDDVKYFALAYTSKSEDLYSRLARVTDSLLAICRPSDALCKVLSDSLVSGFDAAESSPPPQLTSNNLQTLAEQLREKMDQLEDEEMQHPDWTLARNHSRFSLIESLIVSDAVMPAAPSISLQALYMRLLTDLFFKETYSVAFVSTYRHSTKSLIRQWNEYERGLVFQSEAERYEKTKDLVERQLIHMFPIDSSAFGLSVQFLNRAKFVDVLMRVQDFAQEVLMSLELSLGIVGPGETQSRTQIPEVVSPVYDFIKAAVLMRWYRHHITDLRYLLLVPGTSRYAVFQRQDILPRWHNVLFALHGMDPVRRIASGAHVTFENDSWLHPTFLTMSMASLFPCFFRWLTPWGEERDVDMSNIELAERSELFPVSMVEFTKSLVPYVEKTANKEYLDQDPCSVSFHLPVYRFASLGVCWMLCNLFANPRLGYASLDQKINWCQAVLDNSFSPQATLRMTATTFRLMGAVAEMRSKLWTRNGHTVGDRKNNYDRDSPAAHFRDLDLRTLQLSCTRIDPNIFVFLGLKSFGLQTVFNVPTVRMMESGGPFQILFPGPPPQETESVLVEMFFETMSVIVSEMPVCSLGDVSSEDLFKRDLRRAIVHRLASDPLSVSQVVESTFLASFNGDTLRIGEPLIREVLDTIAIWKESSDGLTLGMYELKDEYWSEYDAHYYYESRESKEKSRERWTRIRTKSSQASKTPLPVCPPLRDDIHPSFTQPRLNLIRKLFPFAARTFMRAIRASLIEPTEMRFYPFGWSTNTTFASLYMLTHYARECSTKDDFQQWLVSFPDESIVMENGVLGALCRVVKEAALSSDSIVQDGAKWVVEYVCSRSRECAVRVAWWGLAETSVKAKVNKDKKRLRAQEQSMATMKAHQQRAAQAFNFLEEAGTTITTTTTTNQGEEDDEFRGDVMEMATKSRPGLISLNDAAAAAAAAAVTVSPEHEYYHHALKCSICTDAKDVRRPLATFGFLQSSSVFYPCEEDKHVEFLYNFPSQFGVLKQCGHAVHVDCFERWKKTSEGREDMYSYDAHDKRRDEFVCPYCKTIGNVLVPYVYTCGFQRWQGIQEGDFRIVEKGEEEDWSFNFFQNEQAAAAPSTNRPKPFSDDDGVSEECDERIQSFLRRSRKIPAHVLEHPTESLVKDAATFCVSTFLAIHAFPHENKTKTRLALQSVMGMIGTLKTRKDRNAVFTLMASMAFENKFERSVPIIAGGATFLRRLLGESRAETTLNRVFLDFIALGVFQFIVDPIKEEIYPVDGRWSSSTALLSSPSSSPSSSSLLSASPAANYLSLGSAFAASSLSSSSQASSPATLMQFLYPPPTEFATDFASRAVHPDELAAIKSAYACVVDIRTRRLNDVMDTSEPEIIDETYVFALRKYLAPTIEFFLALSKCCAEDDEYLYQGDDVIRDDYVVTKWWSRFSFHDLIGQSKYHNLIRRLVLNLDEDIAKRRRDFSAPHPLRVRALYTLPVDYTELFTLAKVGQYCDACGALVHEKAVCLICGDVLYAAADCKRNSRDEGECTVHAMSRHAGVAPFFLVQYSKVLLINNLKSALWQSLYLDKNGEERAAAQRGLPLRLDFRRLSKAQEIFARHHIPYQVNSIGATNDRGARRDGYF